MTHRLNRRLLRTAACSLVLLLASASTRAQDISAGYQFQRLTPGGLNVPLGFMVDGSYPLTTRVGVVGQFDWSQRRDEWTSAAGYQTEVTARYSTFGGGLRVAKPSGRVRPFGQGLAGVMHVWAGVTTTCACAGSSLGDADSTRPLVEVDGGVTIAANASAAALLEAGYRRIFFDNFGMNSIRLVVGARFHID